MIFFLLIHVEMIFCILTMQYAMLVFCCVVGRSSTSAARWITRAEHRLSLQRCDAFLPWVLTWVQDAPHTLMRIMDHC